MNKFSAYVIICLSILLCSGSSRKTKPENYSFQCSRPSDGGTHFLVFNSINGKRSGFYLGSEIVSKVRQKSTSYDTIYYYTELKNLIFWENGYLQFELRPVEFYTTPFSIDSFGNITKRPRTKTNSASIDLKSGYTFLGEHLGKALELRRVSPFYLSRSDGFYFTALK